MSVFGLNPIGTIIAWNKSATNTPSLVNQGRTEYVELNGQVLQDAASPYNGQTMPSLNSGQNRYLRGNSTSATLSGATTHTHTVGTTLIGVQSGTGSSVVCAVGSPTGNNNITPVVASFDVVWIYRVK